MKNEKQLSKKKLFGLINFLEKNWGEICNLPIKMEKFLLNNSNNQRQRIDTIWVISIFLFTVLFYGCNCTEVTIPASDTTPPTVSIDIFVDGSKATLLHSANNQPNIDFSNAKTISITVGAQNRNGGVRKITLIHRWWSQANKVTKLIGVTETEIKADSSTAKIGDRVCIDRLLVGAMVPDYLAGNANYKGTISAIAENFSGVQNSTNEIIYEFSGLEATRLKLEGSLRLP